MKATYPIVAEWIGAETYHYEPYHLVASVDEARALMREYIRAVGGNPVDYFVLYKQDPDGEFSSVYYYDPTSLSLEVASSDAVEKFLRRTGRLL